MKTSLIIDTLETYHTTGAWEEDSHPPRQTARAAEMDPARSSPSLIGTNPWQNHEIADADPPWIWTAPRHAAAESPSFTRHRRPEPPPQDPDLASPDLNGTLFMPAPPARHQATAPPPKASAQSTPSRHHRSDRRRAVTRVDVPPHPLRRDPGRRASATAVGPRA